MEKKIPTNPNSEDQNCPRTYGRTGQLNLVESSYGAEAPRGYKLNSVYHISSCIAFQRKFRVDFDSTTSFDCSKKLSDPSIEKVGDTEHCD